VKTLRQDYWRAIVAVCVHMFMVTRNRGGQVPHLLIIITRDTMTAECSSGQRIDRKHTTIYLAQYVLAERALRIESTHDEASELQLFRSHAAQMTREELPEPSNII
jgi:hypothetical protein